MLQYRSYEKWMTCLNKQTLAIMLEKWSRIFLEWWLYKQIRDWLTESYPSESVSNSVNVRRSFSNSSSLTIRFTEVIWNTTSNIWRVRDEPIHRSVCWSGWRLNVSRAFLQQRHMEKYQIGWQKYVTLKTRCLQHRSDRLVERVL